LGLVPSPDHNYIMPTITFDQPAVNFVSLSGLAVGSFVRVGAQAYVVCQQAASTVVARLSDGVVTGMPGTTQGQALTLVSADFQVL